MVLFTYGMETAFFNFSRDEANDKVFSTAAISYAGSTVLLLLAWLTFSQNIANGLNTPEAVDLVKILGFILAFDTLSSLALAKVRFMQRPLRFSWVRLTNIGMNVLFNLYFLLLCPWLIENGKPAPFYGGELDVVYIFISNLLASVLSFVMLMPEFREIAKGFNMALWRKMLAYSWPLILVGFSGVINESVDRIMLNWLLPEETAHADIGKYNAFYKLSIFMTIGIQAFRYAADPFFFDQAKGDNPKPIYARVLLWFTAICSAIFLFVSMFVEPIAQLVIRRVEFFQHPHVMLIVPILLMANLFLGINFNLNIWYKLSNKTLKGAGIALGGAIATILLNLILIPWLGILASAIVTLLVYAGMAVASYRLGQKHYPVPYNLRLIGFFIASAVAIYLIHLFLKSFFPIWLIAASGIVFLGAYLLLAWTLLRPDKKT